MSNTSHLQPSGGAAAVLDGMRGEVRDLTRTLWAARPAGELTETVAAIESLKSSLDALELEVVAELEATNGVRDEGWASTRDFLTAVGGGHLGSGPQMVRLARDLADEVFAPVAGGLADGWLSTTKAVVITRAIDALPGTCDRRRAVEVMLDEAKRLNASELARTGRHLLHTIDPDAQDRVDERALDREARAAHQRRFLGITPDQCGGAWIKGRCSAEDAAMIRSTLMPLAAPIPSGQPSCRPETCQVPGCGHTGRDPRDHGARMLDALTELCRRAQTAELLPDQHGATPRVMITLDLETLRRECGRVTSEDGIDLPASALRRICCDAEIIPVVLGSTSEVLDVGRLHRLVTAAIWKALVARDHHCRFPGCRRPPLMCHAHHVVHWVDGGTTSLANLLLLCGHHHRLVHSGPWRVELDADRHAEFRPPSGMTRERLVSRVSRLSSRPPPRE